MEYFLDKEIWRSTKCTCTSWRRSGIRISSSNEFSNTINWRSSRIYGLCISECYFLILCFFIENWFSTSLFKNFLKNRLILLHILIFFFYSIFNFFNLYLIFNWKLIYFVEITYNKLKTNILKNHLSNTNTQFTVIGAIGPQGCGKSTLLSMLTGNNSQDLYR